MNDPITSDLDFTDFDSDNFDFDKFLESKIKIKTDPNIKLKLQEDISEPIKMPVFYDGKELHEVEREIWRPLDLRLYKKPNFAGNYRISNWGNIQRLGARGTVMLVAQKQGKYLRVNLYYEGKKYAYLLHNLVAMVFLPDTEKKKNVVFKDGDSFNVKATNLDWKTKIIDDGDMMPIPGFMDYFITDTRRIFKKKVLPEKIKYKYSVVQMDKDTDEIIKIYNSIKNASLESQIGIREIRRSCHNQTVFRKSQYYWRVVPNTEYIQGDIAFHEISREKGRKRIRLVRRCKIKHKMYLRRKEKKRLLLPIDLKKEKDKKKKKKKQYACERYDFNINKLYFFVKKYYPLKYFTFGIKNIKLYRSGGMIQDNFDTVIEAELLTNIPHKAILQNIGDNIYGETQTVTIDGQAYYFTADRVER